MHTWIVHEWKVFDYWTGALVDRLVEPFNNVEMFQIAPMEGPHAVFYWRTGAFVDQLIEP